MGSIILPSVIILSLTRLLTYFLLINYMREVNVFRYSESPLNDNKASLFYNVHRNFLCIHYRGIK